MAGERNAKTYFLASMFIAAIAPPYWLSSWRFFRHPRLRPKEHLVLLAMAAGWFVATFVVGALGVLWD